MATINEKMTTLANEVRELSGSTELLSIDEMTTNVSDVNDEVNNQTDLIAQIKGVVDTLPEAGDGSGVEMIEVTYDRNSTGYYAYYFNSSYELTQVNLGSTVSALGGIIMYFGTHSLIARSGDYTVYDTGSYYAKIIKFNADGGRFSVISGGGDN